MAGNQRVLDRSIREIDARPAVSGDQTAVDRAAFDAQAVTVRISGVEGRVVVDDADREQRAARHVRTDALRLVTRHPVVADVAVDDQAALKPHADARRIAPVRIAEVRVNKAVRRRAARNGQSRTAGKRNRTGLVILPIPRRADVFQPAG